MYLSEQERGRRYGLVRRAMSEEGIDALRVVGNDHASGSALFSTGSFRYLTDFFIFSLYGFLLFFREDKPMMLVPMELRENIASSLPLYMSSADEMDHHWRSSILSPSGSLISARFDVPSVTGPRETSTPLPFKYWTARSMSSTSIAIVRKPTCGPFGGGAEFLIANSSSIVSPSVRNTISSISGDDGFILSLRVKPNTSL
jgi:hypothetical protein